MKIPWSLITAACALALGLGACSKSGPRKKACPPLKGKGAYRFVDEVDPADRCLAVREHRVAGTLVAGSHRVRRGPGGQEHRFELAHRGKKLTVHYRGPFPSQARPGARTVVKGKLHKGVFVASEVLAKCPDKYRGRTR